MTQPGNQLRLGRVTELDTLGVGYLRDVKQPMREYLFASRQVVTLPEGPGVVAAESMVWYQLNSVGQVDFLVPANGLAGLSVHLAEANAEASAGWGVADRAEEFAALSR